MFLYYYQRLEKHVKLLVQEAGMVIVGILTSTNGTSLAFTREYAERSYSHYAEQIVPGRAEKVTLTE